jgi:Fe-S-cluster-containing hydrogenase component 2
MYGEFENTFMMYLPRLCEHCLNPTCVASCPSGSIYKREEDGIVLVDQDKCRGWRMCVSAARIQENLLQLEVLARLRNAPSAIRVLKTASQQFVLKPVLGVSAILA